MNTAKKKWLCDLFKFVILTAFFLLLRIFLTNYFPQGKITSNYYVSNSGSDSNSGTSEDFPWRTVEKVNSTEFVAGDVIHFKRGDVWREQLIPSGGKNGRYITYISYGIGAKPLFLGSINTSNRDDWNNEGNNIWKLKSKVLNIDVGNIILDQGKEVGVKVFAESGLKKQNNFWYDKENHTVKINSSKNPAELYNSIECAITQNIIDETNKSYIKYDGLALKYGGAHGIGGGNTHHIWVSNCDINYIGGGELVKGKGNRYGNGIEFWNNTHDNIVEKCNIGEIFDAALTNQGDGVAIKQYNISYRNNIIWNAEYSFEYFNYSKDGETNNIVFENNICSNAGSGWGHNQRPNPTGRQICFWDDNTAQTSSVFIRNNTFKNAKHTCFYISKKWKGIDNLVLENNKVS